MDLLRRAVRVCVLSVQPTVRKGVLPSMLDEILNTRFMVKRSMKTYKQDKALMRLLDARQLGLKLIANVTFGYTAANYSGRMPSVEVRGHANVWHTYPKLHDHDVSFSGLRSVSNLSSAFFSYMSPSIASTGWR